MSRLSDQVEAKIARANRAFRLSSRIIGAAREELEIHGAWLDRHRATWAEEVKRHHRLLKRKLAMRALMRFVVGLVFAAPFALARALEARLKDIPTPASPQSRPAEATPEFDAVRRASASYQPAGRATGRGGRGCAARRPGPRRNVKRRLGFSRGRGFARASCACAFPDGEDRGFPCQRCHSCSHRRWRRWRNVVRPACRSAAACGAEGS